MTMMKAEEIRNVVRDTTAEKLIQCFPELTATKDKAYAYALPIETEDGVFYAKLTVTCCQWYDTKKTPAFNPAEDTTNAVEALAEIKRVRARKAEEKAKAKEEVA